MSFQPVVDEESVVLKYIGFNSIDDSHQKYRLRHNALPVNLRLLDVHDTLRVMSVALFVIVESDNSIHCLPLLVCGDKVTKKIVKIVLFTRKSGKLHCKYAAFHILIVP